MIWNYEPDYKFLEKPKVDHVMISNEKEVDEIIKPYKLIYKQENLLGTVSNTTIDQLIQSLKKIELSNIVYKESNITSNRINEILINPSNLTLFFATDIPLHAFDKILKFKQQSELPNIYINRLVINLQNANGDGEGELLFISTNNQTIYSANVRNAEIKELYNLIQEQKENMFVYEEFEREGNLSLYLTKERQDVIQFTYFIDEFPHELFNSVLFTNPSIVQKTMEISGDTVLEKYSDDIAVVIYDTNSKIMNYVSLAANRYVSLDATSLLKNTIEYVNDHGGFTADYRLSTINESSNIVEYQMYFQGYPVYSTSTLTRIVTTWGNEQINRYRRPYFSLDTDITTVKTVKEILSGEEVVSYLQNQNLSNLKVDEVFVGYHLEKDPSTNVFVLEPSWFALSEGNWIRITTDLVGGTANGLE